MAAIITLNACEKPLAEPEAADPIYQDLRSDADAAEKTIEEKNKEIEERQKALDKPDSDMAVLERKHTLQEIFTAQKTIRLTEQDAHFFKLRADTRKALDRYNYPAIFKAKGKWPDLDEVEAYRAEKRLRGASRNWNDRVPRPAGAPTKENPVAGKTPEAKPEAKTEGTEKKE